MAQPVVARVSRVSVAAKIEATYGTPEAFAAADIILARNPAWRAIIEQHRDERQAGLPEQYPDIVGSRQFELTFEALARGAGAVYSAGVKPELDPIYRACGLSSTGSFGAGAEKYTYEPQVGATMGESITAAVFSENAPQGKLAGAFGTARLVFRAGAPLAVAPRLMGLYTEPTDVALITASLSIVIPPIFASGAVTIDGVARDVSAMELDLGSDVQSIASGNSASAIEGFHIANRRITLTLDPRQVTVATYNWFNKLTAGTRVVATWQVGTVQYNRIKFTANQLQFTEISEVIRNGVKAFQVTAFLASGASPSLSVVYD